MTASQKKKISFVYEGESYSGYVVSSTDILPHFHWFMFDDPKVIARYGDSIAYKVEEEKLVPVYHLTSPEFVKAVEECLYRYLDSLKEPGNT